MIIIKDASFSEERALYNLHDALVKNCRFEGEEDGAFYANNNYIARNYERKRKITGGRFVFRFTISAVARYGRGAFENRNDGTLPRRVVVR